MVELRLAELTAALSLAGDLGMGQPQETTTRSCLLATALAREMGIPDPDLPGVFYTALLQHVGCTAYAYETAGLFGGNDIALRAAGARIDAENHRETLKFLTRDVGKGDSPVSRAHSVFSAIRSGHGFDHELARSNCEAATHIARRLGLGEIVDRSLNEIYERWDGKGQPLQLMRDDIALPARFAQVASQAALFATLGGPDVACEMLRQRSGTMLDPVIANAAIEHFDDLLATTITVDSIAAVVEAEPGPLRHVSGHDLERVASAFAEMVDLQSPYFHGHALAVSILATAAATDLGLPEAEVDRIRIAGGVQWLDLIGGYGESSRSVRIRRHIETGWIQPCREALVTTGSQIIERNGAGAGKRTVGAQKRRP